MMFFLLLNRLHLEECDSMWKLVIVFSMSGCLLKWINLNMKNFISCVFAIEQRASFFYYNVNQKLYIICCRNFIKDFFQLLESKNLQKHRGLVSCIGLVKMIVFAVLKIFELMITVHRVKRLFYFSLVKIYMILMQISASNFSWI